MLSKLLTLLALAALPALAQYEVKDGYCEQGGQKVVGPGNQLSTTYAQRSYPSCTVQVTLSAGGSATIFSDSTGTPLANPFTAATNGYYFFFIVPNVHFNVTISGGGLAAPITHSYYLVGGSGGGGGTLTSINAQGGPAVTIAAGTAGTNFAVSAAGNTVTLNLPSASATNRGALSSADWSTFNSKENGLTFSSPLSRATNTISLTTVGITLGGTGQTTKTPAFNALSPLTTKGDVIGFDGTNNVRLGVGANNSCLIADSTQTTGLRYDATCHMAIGGTITSSTSGSLLYVSAGLLAQSLMSGGGTQCVQVDNSGIPSGTGGPCAATGSNVVKTDQSNTYSTGNQDFRNATAFETRVAAGGTTTVNGGLVYDSTGNQLHAGISLTDRILVFRASGSTPTAGNCVQWGALGIVSDAGSACGSGGSGITTLTGDVTAGPGSGSQAAIVVNLPSGVTQAGHLLATAIAAPGTPSAGKGAIYVDSASKNLSVKDDAGVIKHGVQTDTGTANNYISAISDSGAITKSRPACATLSDSGTGCSAAAGMTQLTGDVTAGAGSGSQAATVVNLPTGVTQSGYLQATAIVAPGTPAAGKGRIYEDSTSKNLAIKDDAGIVKHGVQTQAAVAGNFVTAISDAGGVTISGGVPCTATLVTCTIYDSTATTGKSKLAVRAGAGQTTGDNLQEWQLNAGTVLLEVTNGANLQAVTSGAGKAQFGQGGLAYSSDSEAKWFSGTDINGAGSYDLGICRGAAGQLNINDGSTTCTNLAALAAASMKTGSSAPTCTAGTGGPICLHEGTAVTGEASADNCYGDSTDHDIKCSFNNDTIAPLARGPSSATTTGHCVQFADTKGSNLSDAGAACGSGSGGSGFSGSVSLGTSAITSGTCATVVTSTQTGMASTDTLAWTFNADPTGVTGYSPSTSGMLTIIAYPTTNTANFKVCNNTASSVTPGAITLNFSARQGSIAAGTSALGTGAITSGTCATVVTTAASGTATTNTVAGSFNGDPTAVTGYSPTTGGMLTIIGYPTANNVNWKVCNNTTGSITPGAITLNWRVF